MNNFNELKRFVDEGKLKFTFLVSLKRSNSTAFDLCITRALEKQDVQIAHPWSKSERWNKSTDLVLFDSGLGIILKEVLNRLETTSKTPIRVFINAHPWTLTHNEFEHILKLSDQFCFNFRDPYSQLKSTLIRNYHFRIDASFEPTLEEALKYLPENKLIEYATSLRNEWESFMGQYNLVKKNASKKLILNDGFTLCAFPEECIKNVCETIGFVFDINMIDSWKDTQTKYTNYLADVSGGNVFGSRDGEWTGPATSSTGIKRVNLNDRYPGDASFFPELLHPFLEQNFEIYKELSGDIIHQSYLPTAVELNMYREVNKAYVAARECQSPQTLRISDPGHNNQNKNRTEIENQILESLQSLVLDHSRPKN